MTTHIVIHYYSRLYIVMVGYSRSYMVIHDYRGLYRGLEGFIQPKISEKIASEKKQEVLSDNTSIV